MQRQEQRIHREEAEEIVRLAAQRQAENQDDGPTVDGLAGALGLPPEEVERLLAEVRHRRTAPPTAAQPLRSRFGDRSAALSAGLVLALVIVLAGIGFGGYTMFGPKPAPESDMLIRGPDGATIRMNDRGLTIENVTDVRKADANPPPTPEIPFQTSVEGAGQDGLRTAIDALRKQAAEAATPEARAGIEAALAEAEAQLKAPSGE